jgi:dihydroorotate dehydrogenase (NAD+) catalytic subunit
MPQNLPATTDEPDLSVDLAGMRLANPMMTASGTCGYAYEYADLVDLTRLGAFVTKSISAEVRAGNAPDRIVETRAGMLNAIGLANVGLDVFLDEKLPELRRMRADGPRIIVNVVGHRIDDYVKTAGRIASEPDVDAIELNVSCPNVSDGLVFGTDPELLEKLVREVRGAMRDDCRLIVKLSPNVADVAVTARAAVEGGAQILSMINTFTAMAVDIEKRTPRLANGTGGLSGPAIRPLAVYLISRVYRKVARDAGVPIIAMGGIQYWQDAVEFLLCGASGLAVGTALFVDPATPVQILEGLRAYLSRHGCKSIAEIRGGLEMPDDPPESPYH